MLSVIAVVVLRRSLLLVVSVFGAGLCASAVLCQCLGQGSVLLLCCVSVWGRALCFCCVELKDATVYFAS